MEGNQDYSPVDHVTDAEIDDLVKTKDEWFEGKNDAERVERILNNANFLRRWAVDKGAKKEPNFPPNVQKISNEFSLESEGIHYRYSEDAPDPHMIWGIDLENDPAAFEESKEPYVVLRVVKDSEISQTIIEIKHAPTENRSKELQIGTTVLQRDHQTGELDRVNFPPRRIERLSTQELKFVDLTLRNTKESLANPARQPKSNIPPKFRNVQ